MSRLPAILRRLSPADPRHDGHLLAAFLARHDEAAFAELVRRHGPVVWGVCRRHLPDPADAEDAFQAVFLVLVRRAGRLDGAPSVGPWLYKVAAWTARNLRRKNARRLARRRDVPADHPLPLADADLALDLDTALLALPEKYRTPLVLCHLQGWSRREAAARLGCPEGTLSALLSRGLAKLRQKLAGRDPLPLLAAAAVTAPVPLSAATARATAAFHVAAAAATPLVAELAEGVIRMMWVKKVSAAGVAAVMLLTAGVGVGLGVRQTPAFVAADEKPAAGKPEPAGGKVAPEATKEAELAHLRMELIRSRDILDATRADVERAENVRKKAEFDVTKVEYMIRLVEQLQAKADDAERWRRQLAAEADQATRTIADVRAEIARLKAESAKAALRPTGPYIEIVLGRRDGRPGQEQVATTLTSYGAAGKPTRPGTDELVIVIEKGVTGQRIKDLIGACRTLGFTGSSVANAPTPTGVA